MSRRSGLRYAFGILLATACESNQPALAVSTVTPSGSQLRWPKHEVVLRLSPSRPRASVNSEVRESLQRAVRIWNKALSGCRAPHLTVAQVPLARPLIREDRVNEVLYHDHEWCPPGAADFDECYDRTLHASTRLRPEQRPGHATDGDIKEADMEVNGVDFRWSATGEKDQTLSLVAVFTHELGHVLGLDHPCAPKGSPLRKSGRVQLDCDDVRLQRAVMHPNAAELLARRSVRPLDAEVNAVCEAYGK